MINIQVRTRLTTVHCNIHELSHTQNECKSAAENQAQIQTDYIMIQNLVSISGSFDRRVARHQLPQHRIATSESDFAARANKTIIQSRQRTDVTH